MSTSWKENQANWREHVSKPTRRLLVWACALEVPADLVGTEELEAFYERFPGLSWEVYSTPEAKAEMERLGIVDAGVEYDEESA